MAYPSTVLAAGIRVPDSGYGRAGLAPILEREKESLDKKGSTIMVIKYQRDEPSHKEKFKLNLPRGSKR